MTKMNRTPGMLNPNSFPSLEAFLEEDKKRGLEQGWTPMEKPVVEEEALGHVLDNVGDQSISSKPSRRFVGRLKLKDILKR